jgi:hypothetical protein
MELAQIEWLQRATGRTIRIPIDVMPDPEQEDGKPQLSAQEITQKKTEARDAAANKIKLRQMLDDQQRQMEERKQFLISNAMRVIEPLRPVLREAFDIGFQAEQQTKTMGISHKKTVQRDFIARDGDVSTSGDVQDMTNAKLMKGGEVVDRQQGDKLALEVHKAYGVLRGLRDEMLSETIVLKQPNKAGTGLEDGPKVKLFTQDEIISELFDPLVRSKILPDAFIEDAYSRTQAMLDATNELYKKDLTDPTKFTARGVANTTKGLIDMASGVCKCVLEATGTINANDVSVTAALTGATELAKLAIDTGDAIDTAWRTEKFDKKGLIALLDQMPDIAGQAVGAATGNSALQKVVTDSATCAELLVSAAISHNYDDSSKAIGQFLGNLTQAILDGYGTQSNLSTDDKNRNAILKDTLGKMLATAMKDGAPVIGKLIIEGKFAKAKGQFARMCLDAVVQFPTIASDIAVDKGATKDSVTGVAEGWTVGMGNDKGVITTGNTLDVQVGIGGQGVGVQEHTSTSQTVDPGSANAPSPTETVNVQASKGPGGETIDVQEVTTTSKVTDLKANQFSREQSDEYLRVQDLQTGQSSVQKDTVKDMQAKLDGTTPKDPPRGKQPENPEQIKARKELEALRKKYEQEEEKGVKEEIEEDAEKELAAFKARLRGDDKQSRNQNTIDKMIADLKRDQAIMATLIAVGQGGAAIAGKFVSYVAIGTEAIALAANAKLAYEKMRAAYEFNQELKGARETANAYGTAIDNFFGNQKFQLTAASINVALNGVKLVCAAVAAAVPHAAPAVPASQALSAGVNAVLGGIKQAKLKKSWQATKNALQNPKNRRLGLKARKMNPTLAKYTIAYGAMEEDPIAVSMALACGLNEQTLKNPSSNVAKVKAYLEAKFPDDGTVVGYWEQDKGWENELPEPKLNTVTLGKLYKVIGKQFPEQIGPVPPGPLAGLVSLVSKPLPKDAPVDDWQERSEICKQLDDMLTKVGAEGAKKAGSRQIAAVFAEFADLAAEAGFDAWTKTVQVKEKESA